MRTVFFLLATMAGLALSATTETGAMANSADTDLAGTSDYTDLGDLAGLADDMGTAEAPDAAARWCSRRCRRCIRRCPRRMPMPACLYGECRRAC